MEGCRNRSAMIPFVQPEMEIGSIILWGLTELEIPAGWQKADGTNGTRNLTDLFVKAAGGGDAQGDTGGNLTHNHSFTSNSHDHGFTGLPPHFGQVGAGVHNMTTADQVTGTTQNRVLEPPYMALFYIQKVA